MQLWPPSKVRRGDPSDPNIRIFHTRRPGDLCFQRRLVIWGWFHVLHYAYRVITCRLSPHFQREVSAREVTNRADHDLRKRHAASILSDVVKVNLPSGRASHSFRPRDLPDRRQESGYRNQECSETNPIHVSNISRGGGGERLMSSLDRNPERCADCDVCLTRDGWANPRSSRTYMGRIVCRRCESRLVRVSSCEVGSEATNLKSDSNAFRSVNVREPLGNQCSVHVRLDEVLRIEVESSSESVRVDIEVGNGLPVPVAQVDREVDGRVRLDQRVQRGDGAANSNDAHGSSPSDSAGETSDDTGEGDLGDVPDFAIDAELLDLFGQFANFLSELGHVDVARGVIVEGLESHVELFNHTTESGEYLFRLVLSADKLVKDSAEVANRGVQVGTSCDGNDRHCCSPSVVGGCGDPQPTEGEPDRTGDC